MTGSPFGCSRFAAAEGRGATVRRVGWSMSLWILWVLLPAAGVLGQGPGPPTSELRTHVISFEHQPAEEAVELVLPLLSPRGSIEIRPGGNTLVVRDTVAALTEMMPLLVSLDHPSRPIEVFVWLLRAEGSQVSPPVPSASSLGSLPPAVLQNLKDHLPFGHYEVLAQNRVEVPEGEEAVLDLQGDFEVRFRLGTVVAGKRLRLHGFEVRRGNRAGEEPLLKSHLNVWLDRPAAVAFSSKGQRAGSKPRRVLIVVVDCRLVDLSNRRER